MRAYLHLVLFLALAACASAPPDPEPAPTPAESTAGLACERATRSVALMDGNLTFERGLQGGAHFRVQLDLTGVPAATPLRIQALDGAGPVNTMWLDANFEDRCAMSTTLIFESDDYYWAVDDDGGFRDIELEVAAMEADAVVWSERFAGTLETVR